MLQAVFFPANPEALVFDMEQTAVQALRAGLKLYTDGLRFALLARPLPGWALFKGSEKCPQ